MNGILEITLKSDLCAGSGYSYAGMIDTDAVYDSCGLPYIPARRLKGCLREAACLIHTDDRKIETLFGVSGNDHSGSLKIGNAVLKNYSVLAKSIRAGIKQNRMTVYEVLDEFTSVRAATRIDRRTNTAEDNSLRYIRVVNHYSPLDGKEMVFEAPVSFSGDAVTFIRIAKALRSIGMNRNRGLGAVGCRFIRKDDENNRMKINVPSDADMLTLLFENEEPLVLTDLNDVKTETFIRGRSVLGAAANLYLKKYGKDAADGRTFRQLFLDGSTVFTNAYPAVRTDCGWMRTVPASFYMNKMKKSGKLVNLLCENDTDGDPAYSWENGNQPKLLKGKYLCRLKNDSFIIKEPDTDIDYHHSEVQPSGNGQNGILYTSEVLRPGQHFMCSIYSSPENIRLLAELFEGQEICFGKSKTAQYGKCTVEEMKAEKDGSHYEQMDGLIAVTLCSDAIFKISDEGMARYTVDFDETAAEIAAELELSDYEVIGEKSFAQAGETNGYYGKWNLKRQALPCIKAGSTYVFRLAYPQMVRTNIFVGRGGQDCCGEAAVEPLKAMHFRVTEEKEKEMPSVSISKKERKTADVLAERIGRRRLMNNLIIEYFDQKKRLGITASALGRVTLMLRESMDQYGNNSRDVMAEFLKRVASIKTASTRKKVEEFIAMESKPEKHACADENRTMFEELLPSFILNILVIEKYRKGANA